MHGKTEGWRSRLYGGNEQFVGFVSQRDYLIHRINDDGDEVWQCRIDTVMRIRVCRSDIPIVQMTIDRQAGILWYATDPNNTEDLQVHQVCLQACAGATPLSRMGGITLALGQVFQQGGDSFVALEHYEDGQFELCACRAKGTAVSVLMRSQDRLRLLAFDKRGGLLVQESRAGLNGALILLDRDGVRRLALPASHVISATFDGDVFVVVSDLRNEHAALWRVDAQGDTTCVFRTPTGNLEQYGAAPGGRDLAYAVVFERLRHRLLLCRAGRVIKEISGVPNATLSQISWSPCGRWLGMTIDQAFVGKRAALYDVDSDVWIYPPAPAPDAPVIETTVIETPAGLVETGIYRPEFTNKTAMPVMVSAHGGPALRFDFSSCPEIECFADFGFAVVAPNFRGSSGYGRSFLEADDGRLRLNAYRDWLATIDNLALILAHPPGPVVQMGASYGSFLALNGSIDRPPAAAISLFGISHFPSFLERTANWRRVERESEYGSLARDRAYLDRISPLRRIGDLSAPLLLSHGTNDVRVCVEQSRAVKSAREGIPYPTYYEEVEGAGHGYRSFEQRAAFIDSVSRFLDDHVPC